MAFWHTLPPGFTCLAPMEGVTDTVFRQIVAECGAPDVFFTEFMNVEGFVSAGKKKVAQRLRYTPVEKPLIAQIWGLKPENFETAARELVELGFDGIDINMGCPDRNVIKHGAGSALINDRPLAAAIIAAVKQGAGDRVPVSVKIRIGYKHIDTESWAAFILSQGIDALTVHGRTTKEMSKVPARWEEIAKVVKLRDSLSKKTMIIGNGDVMSLAEVKEKVTRYGVDGVMIGRGVFANPFVFNPDKCLADLDLPARLDLIQLQVDLFEATWGEQKHFDILKRYFKIYLRDVPGIADIREQLMITHTYVEVTEVLKSIRSPLT